MSNKIVWSSNDLKLTFMSFISFGWHPSFVVYHYTVEQYKDSSSSWHSINSVYLIDDYGLMVRGTITLLLFLLLILQALCFSLYFVLFEGWFNKNNYFALQRDKVLMCVGNKADFI